MQSRRSPRVPRVLCNELPSPQRPTLVEAEEAAHLHQVLRLKDGAPVIALDGRGRSLFGRYALRDKKIWIYADDHSVVESRLPSEEITPITLEVAVIKGDSMSWIIEKAVELGVQRLVPILCDYGVIQTERKGLQHFLERWQRIADQALKQCERLHRLVIDSPQALEDLFRQPLSANASRWVALEPKAQADWKGTVHKMSSDLFKSDLQSHCLIGPEGGWSGQELRIFEAESAQNRLEGLALGPLVLRAETAAVFVMSCALSSRLRD